MKVFIIFLTLILVSTPVYALSNAQRSILKIYHSHIQSDQDLVDAYEQEGRAGRITIILAWITTDLRPKIIRIRNKVQNRLNGINQAVQDWGG